MDERFARNEGSTRSYFLTDALGSTVALANADGSLIQQYQYDPYGNAIATPSTTNPYQYTGRENDGTGLYYYRARYYSAAMGRFISEDPLGFGGGQNNFYAYVGGNPLGYTDPYGLMQWPPDIFSQGFVNASAGFGDGLSFGLTALARRGLGIESVDECSGAYTKGTYVGTATSIVVGLFIGTGEAELAAEADGAGLNFSQRVLARMAEEPGPYHNFPTSIGQAVLDEGEANMVNYNYTVYSLEGSVNGVNGTYQVDVNAANEITHYFFEPF